MNRTIYQTKIEIEEEDDCWRAAVRAYTPQGTVLFEDKFSDIESAMEWTKKLADCLHKVEISF